MTTRTILNLVHTAKAHGASDEALAILTPQFLKKLKRRVSNVIRHHDSKSEHKPVALLLGQPIGDFVNNLKAAEWQDKMDYLLKEESEEVLDNIKEWELAFGNGKFNYTKLMELSRCNPLEDWDYGLEHPAWIRFNLKLREELTNKLVKLVNKVSLYATV